MITKKDLQCSTVGFRGQVFNVYHNLTEEQLGEMVSKVIAGFFHAEGLDYFQELRRVVTSQIEKSLIFSELEYHKLPSGKRWDYAHAFGQNYFPFEVEEKEEDGIVEFGLTKLEYFALEIYKHRLPADPDNMEAKKRAIVEAADLLNKCLELQDMGNPEDFFK